MSGSNTLPPDWKHWDSDTYAKHFHGREITLFEFPQGGKMGTTYRADYPEPPLYWQHQPPPDHSNRPTPAFGHTTSHRADYIERPFHGAAQVMTRPQQQFTPKLSAMTTARNDYKVPALPPATQPRRTASFVPNDDPMGTTTMRADYVEWKMPGGRQKSPSLAAQPTKFHGMTTTRNDYPWPAALPPPRENAGNPIHEVPLFDGTTEYRAKYELVPLPLGLPADIGLQVATRAYKSGGVGGQFHLMIKQGAPAPCGANKTFTTVVDQQQSAAIVVVAKRPEFAHGVILGHFSMEGIYPEKVGIPKVEVTLKLVNEKTLQASALYKQGKKTKALTFQAKKGPPLRTVAQASEVPKDF